jgi:hypothetical protein
MRAVIPFMWPLGHAGFCIAGFFDRRLAEQKMRGKKQTLERGKADVTRAVTS